MIGARRASVLACFALALSMWLSHEWQAAPLVASPVSTCAAYSGFGSEQARCPPQAQNVADVARQLEVHGFAHLPGVLDADSLQEARGLFSEYARQRGRGGYGTFGGATAQGIPEEALWVKAPRTAAVLEKLFTSVGERWSPAIDRFDPVHHVIFNFNTSMLNQTEYEHDRFHFGRWHQDSEPHLIWESDPHRYLHLVVPLWNINDEQGLNVQYVPWDTLERCSPAHAQLLRNRSAGKFFHREEISAWGQFIRQLFDQLPETTRVMRFDEKDNSLVGFDFDPDVLACTPRMRVGDVVLFRGDTVHRTEPWREERATGGAARARVSLHAGAFSGSSKVRMSDVLRGSLRKYRIMSKSIRYYADQLALICMYGSREATQGELRDRMLQHWDCRPERSFQILYQSQSGKCAIPGWRLLLVDILALWFRARLLLGLQCREWTAKLFPI